jgi:hypothetical protein
VVVVNFVEIAILFYFSLFDGLLKCTLIVFVYQHYYLLFTMYFFNLGLCWDYFSILSTSIVFLWIPVVWQY